LYTRLNGNDPFQVGQKRSQQYNKKSGDKA